MLAEPWIISIDVALNEKWLRVIGCNFERQHVKVCIQFLQPHVRVWLQPPATAARSLNEMMVKRQGKRKRLKSGDLDAILACSS